jgi:hypothetical protein
MAMPLCVLTTKPCPLRFAGAGFAFQIFTLRFAFAPLSQAVLPNWPGAGDAKHGDAESMALANHAGSNTIDYNETWPTCL